MILASCLQNSTKQSENVYKLQKLDLKYISIISVNSVLVHICRYGATAIPAILLHSLIVLIAKISNNFSFWSKTFDLPVNTKGFHHTNMLLVNCLMYLYLLNNYYDIL